MHYRTTSDLRNYLADLLEGVEAGKISNATARARVGIVKAMVDTLKVEIAATALGREIHPLVLEAPPQKRLDAA